MRTFLFLFSLSLVGCNSSKRIIEGSDAFTVVEDGSKTIVYVPCEPGETMLNFPESKIEHQCKDGVTKDFDKYDRY